MLLSTIFTACSTTTSSNKIIKIGISQLVEHPALDSAREGFIEALKEAGYEDGKNI
ncbi:MAG: ABC transporter substrate binding protein, partial [Clostridia bacterium]